MTDEPSSPDDLTRLQAIWQTLGQEDPLWAVASNNRYRGRRWDLAEFLATGEQDVARYIALLAQQPDAPKRFNQVLDFGCGVGRLTRLWCQRADQVTGLDISASMLNQARIILNDYPQVKLILNEKNDLACCLPAQFDLIFSHICLQHMPWSLASNYVREFARVCRTGGWVIFQLPAREAVLPRAARLRRRLVESLPFNLGTAWRKWRHGTSVVFDVYYTPPEAVVAVATGAGLHLCHQEPDQSAGHQTEGFIYLFRKL